MDYPKPKAKAATGTVQAKPSRAERVLARIRTSAVQEVLSNTPPVVKPSITAIEPTEVTAPTRTGFNPALITPDALRARVAGLTKMSTYEPEQHYYLDTGSYHLNRTLGSGEDGIPYGKVLELSGLEHAGKTALATIIMGMAQRDGAAAGYIDLEESRDEAWATKLGCDWSQIFPVYPKLVISAPARGSKAKQAALKKKDKENELAGKVKPGKADAIPRLQYAEEIFEEAEYNMQLLQKAGYKKQFWLIDSLANIQTMKQVDAGLVNQTMNTGMARAVFLSQMLPRWAGLAANYNAMIVCINQLRMKQGIVFGDPFETSGGQALKHACAVRARGRRLKNGRLKAQGKVIGLVGVLTNVKNKSGRNSVEGESCGYKIKWNKAEAEVAFMSVKEAEDLIKGE